MCRLADEVESTDWDAEEVVEVMRWLKLLIPQMRFGVALWQTGT